MWPDYRPHPVLIRSKPLFPLLEASLPSIQGLGALEQAALQRRPEHGLTVEVHVDDGSQLVCDQTNDPTPHRHA